MTRSYASRHESDQGFTILELLVSLALMSLILVVILGGIGGGRLTLQHVNQSDGEVELRATQSLLRNLLTETRPIPAIDSGSDIPFVFVGAQNQLTFYSAYTVEGQVGGIYRSTLLLSSQSARRAGLNLVLQQRMHRPTFDSITNTRVPEATTVLVQSIEGLRIRYYGRAEPGKPAAWLSSWALPRSLPELVEIRLDFAADDGRAWHARPHV